MTHELKVTVLVDNNTLIDRYFLGEPSLSLFVEADGKRVLFDAGYSDLFLRNASRMGIELLTLDSLVFSHGHLDHTGGFPHLLRHFTEASIEGASHTLPDLIAHPYALYPRPKPPIPNIGSLITEEEAGLHLPVRTIRTPFWLTRDLVFLGEIPRDMAFEETDPGLRRIIFPDGRNEPDRILDDSALAYRSEKGLVIITGCSHAGIGNITAYARQVCGEEQVVDIIGGLHLTNASRQKIQMTGEYLAGLHLDALHCCHCTSLPATIALARCCPVQETGVGLSLTYPE
jgi:7,8-dihydropterin-6-yl-methyl-4-(beta-D-ribofuranosyl)aminobenzene 5'-phosphate synthase